MPQTPSKIPRLRVTTTNSRAWQDAEDFNDLDKARAAYEVWAEEIASIPAGRPANYPDTYTIHAALWEMSSTRWVLVEAASYTFPSAPVRSRLTGSESQLLWLLAAGQSNKECARILNISVRTVETHRLNFRRKLGLTSRVKLVAKACEIGLGPGTPPPFRARASLRPTTPGQEMTA